MKAETVVLLNKIYCWIRAGGWLLMGLMCFWARGKTELVYEQSRELFQQFSITQDMLVPVYSVLGFASVILCFLNLILAFAPMTKKCWKAHIFNHVIGILECCCLPLGLPLLILWLRPDVKSLFDESLPPYIVQ